MSRTLLDAGIDVYSTINIQHVESLNDVVASFTRVRVRETVPDSILENAEIEVVDIPPDELIERLREGEVYIPQEATRALTHFFSKSNLTALRETRAAPRGAGGRRADARASAQPCACGQLRGRRTDRRRGQRSVPVAAEACPRGQAARRRAQARRGARSISRRGGARE